MRLQTIAMMVAVLGLTACASNNFEPREKTARYEPTTGELTLPHPCPDWSQTQDMNYEHQLHSNYGCAVNTNSALQVADPSDLYRGHGTNSPDIEITTGVVKQYREGKIPVPLMPLQDSGGTSQ